MENPIVIDVARDFSKRPVGRYRANGSYTGEAFREDVLLPLIVNMSQSNPPRIQKITVDFSGVTMSGSSFLEEAFGGLVLEMQKRGLVGSFYNPERPQDLFEIISHRRPAIVDSVYCYMIDVLKK